MEAQTVWKVWRRILQENGFQGELFTASSSTLAERFGLNPEEIEIAKTYALTPQRTQLFITNYRFRLINSFINSLYTGAPLTFQVLIVQDAPIKILAQQFLDKVGWRDYGPNVLTYCAEVLKFIKEDVVTLKPKGFRDLIDLEAASVSLIKRFAFVSTIKQSAQEIEKNQISPNGNSIVIATSHTLTPWLKDPSLLGAYDLEPIPQHFLIYLPTINDIYKLAGIPERGYFLLNILTKPMTRQELNYSLETAGFPLLQYEDDLIIQRLLSYGVISIGSDFSYG